MKSAKTLPRKVSRAIGSSSRRVSDQDRTTRRDYVCWDATLDRDHQGIGEQFGVTASTDQRQHFIASDGCPVSSAKICPVSPPGFGVLPSSDTAAGYPALHPLMAFGKGFELCRRFPGVLSALAARGRISPNVWESGTPNRVPKYG
jgi:hypothetical protein